MTKTNFTKVEEVLDKGLRKYTVEHLLEEADQASGKQAKPRNPTIAYSSEGDKPEEVKLTKEQQSLIVSLERDLKLFKKKGKELYSKLGIAKRELMSLIENKMALTPDQWQRVQQTRAKLDGCRAEWKKEPSSVTDESLVETERKEHIYRRYNVNKKWLPLK